MLAYSWEKHTHVSTSKGQANQGRDDSVELGKEALAIVASSGPCRTAGSFTLGLGSWFIRGIPPPPIPAWASIDQYITEHAIGCHNQL